MVSIKQVSNTNTLSNNTNNAITATMSQMVSHHDESQIRVVQQTQPSHQIMHLQLPSSIVSTAANNLVGNTITITEAYPGSNTDVSFKSLQANNSSNNSIHDAAVLNLPTSLANFVQQAQIVDTTTGQIMGHVKIQK